LKKQDLITLLTIEPEYIAATHTVKGAYLVLTSSWWSLLITQTPHHSSLG
jgi:hypothetical protein